MSLATLLLLRRILLAQQLHVGNEDFREAARAVLVALDELDEAIAAAASAGDAQQVVEG